MIDLVIRFKLTQAFLIPRFSNCVKNYIIHFFAFFYNWKHFPQSHGFVATPVTSRTMDSCSYLSLSNWWRETKLFDLVTGTTSKPCLSGNIHVTKYKTMQTWMVEFVRKFENTTTKGGCSILRARFVSPKSIFTVIYLYFVRCWGSVVMLTSLN